MSALLPSLVCVLSWTSPVPLPGHPGRPGSPGIVGQLTVACWDVRASRIEMPPKTVTSLRDGSRLGSSARAAAAVARAAATMDADRYRLFMKAPLPVHSRTALRSGSRADVSARFGSVLPAPVTLHRE